MKTPLEPALADWIGYLADIGYGDLRRAGPAGAAAPAERQSSSDVAPQPSDGSTRGSRSAVSEPDGEGERADALRVLGEKAAGCVACRLASQRGRVVFGSGPSSARLMLVGEGPGAEEDRQGLPFVGRAGELLTRILAAIDERRDEVYIANIVKCRPPANREPEADEVEACIGFLERQIDLVKPRVIVCLGRISAQTLLGNAMPIGRMRGNWYNVRGIETMVTYHPAALLRNPSLKRPTWEDMQKVRDRLRELN